LIELAAIFAGELGRQRRGFGHEMSSTLLSPRRMRSRCSTVSEASSVPSSHSQASFGIGALRPGVVLSLHDSD